LPKHQAGVKPTGDDYVKFQTARDKKGSAEVKDAATSRTDAFTDVEVKMNDPNAWSADQTKALGRRHRGGAQGGGGEGRRAVEDDRDGGAREGREAVLHEV
jgi:hypothetical protein